MSDIHWFFLFISSCIKYLWCENVNQPKHSENIVGGHFSLAVSEISLITDSLHHSENRPAESKKSFPEKTGGSILLNRSVSFNQYRKAL